MLVGCCGGCITSPYDTGLTSKIGDVQRKQTMVMPRPVGCRTKPSAPEPRAAAAACAHTSEGCGRNVCAITAASTSHPGGFQATCSSCRRRPHAGEWRCRQRNRSSNWRRRAGDTATAACNKPQGRRRRRCKCVRRSEDALMHCWRVLPPEACRRRIRAGSNFLRDVGSGLDHSHVSA